MPKYLKPRPNVPFDGITCARYDVDRIKNKVVFTVLGETDLWVQFCSGYAPKKTQIDFYIDNFKSYTALEVIREINSFNATKGTKTFGDWGNHFEDGVLEIWRALDLPFGWVAPITRPYKK